MQENNVNSLSYNQYRNENVIRHPPESYVEVSTRSIFKLRTSTNNMDKKAKSTSRKENLSFSVWTLCLGAILGYIPGIISMLYNKELDILLIVYVVVFVVGMIAFFKWRELDKGSSAQLNDLIRLINEEFSEDRIPTNQDNFSGLSNSIDDHRTNDVTIKYSNMA